MHIWGWETMLKIENLIVNYGGIEAVKGISLEVPDGSIITHVVAEIWKTRACHLKS